MNDLKEKALKLPQLPGVYIMKDDADEVLYIGKASRLKNRVSSYFNREHDGKTEAMTTKIEDFDAIVVESEFEALLLENSLIKECRPKYNVKLRDDKGYPVIRVDVRKEYPEFKIVSNPVDDGALYLGPFGGRTDTRRAIAEVSKALKLPTCGKNIKRIIGTTRPCLNYDMGNCLGFCQRADLADEYRNSIAAAIDIFQGKTGSLIKRLTNEMEEASNNLLYEQAAVLRDRIKAIKVLEQKQFFKEEPIEEHAQLYKEKMLKTQEWLRKALKLEKTPERIEAYDISNTGASDIVGSMTVFINGKPLKRDYRRFKIKSKRKQDDYGSMKEIVSRRIKRYLADDEKFSILPDLMLIDGGANHASAVRSILQDLNINVPVFGMVKDAKHRTRALISPDGEEIGLASNPAAYAFIGSIQEETHRFVVEYHRKLRSKTMLES
ncbi:MAG: excinuclease ABC subunit UvrC [Oscillospiraceae bacterium]|jgi:excinuclease ABC subunit C|nr:excinuclease ABC subunit UvrC [Oscillospiraceae bacterium]